MARVQMRLPPAMAGGQTFTRTEQSKEEPKYTVMMEQVSQPKKKLLSKNSFKIQPPKGYTYIALKEPTLTDKCKELSRLSGTPIHIVSTSRGGQRSTELSQQVGRIGHHFASEIVGKALSSLGLDMDAAGRLRVQFEKARKSFGTEAARKDQKGTRVGEGITDPAQLKKEQEKLYSDSRTMLKTLFPRMPEKDVKSVVKHAFTISKDRIGSSAEVSLDRRVHLAVMAHIRHSYTDYDKLLKQVPYQTARSIVEQATLTKMIEWRGEDDKDDDQAVEEIMREVIVINDDDDDDPQSPNSVDDDLEFSSEQVPADQIDDRPSTRMVEPYYSDSRHYAYGKRPHMPDDRADQDRIARENAIVAERLRRAREHVKMQEAGALHARPNDIAPILSSGERRILIPVSQADQHHRYEHEPPRRLIHEPAGRDRELILVRPANGQADHAPSRTVPPGYFDAHAQVGARRLPETGTRSSVVLQSRPPVYPPSPVRQGEIIHQSIESPGHREVVEIGSSPPRDEREQRPRQQPVVYEQRHPRAEQRPYPQNAEGVLGKRHRHEDDFDHSSVKAQRPDGYATPRNVLEQQIVTLSKGEHMYHPDPRDHVEAHRPTMASAPIHAGDEQRRYAHPARRLSDEVRQDTVQYDPSRPRRSPPVVQYIPVPKSSDIHTQQPRYVDAHGVSIQSREAPPPYYRDVHGHPRHIDGVNEHAYRHNDHPQVYRPQPAHYDRRDEGAPRITAGRDTQYQGVHPRLEQQRESRVVYEPVPTGGRMVRHAHSNSGTDKHGVEQSRSAMQDLRIHDKYQTAQPMYDEHGRRIIILEAPR